MSDWKAGSLKRRDARATKIEETSPGQGRKKNTKRWCKGKVGREHVPACRKINFGPFGDSNKEPIFLGYEKYCTACGKGLDFWRGSSRSKKPKPDWVVEERRPSWKSQK